MTQEREIPTIRRQVCWLHALFVALLGAFLFLNLETGGSGKLLAAFFAFAMLTAGLVWRSDRDDWSLPLLNFVAVCVISLAVWRYGASAGLNGLVVLPLLAAALRQPPVFVVALLLFALLSQGLAVPDWSSRYQLLQFFLPGVAVLAIVMFQRNQKESLDRRVVRLEILDALTGVHNIRAFNNLLQHSHRLAKRHGYLYSVVAVDLVGLNSINQKFGREAGNGCLQCLAEALQETMRATDVLARAGGGEFLILLPATDHAGAGLCIQRIRERIASLTYDAKGSVMQMAVHAGMATYPTDQQEPGEIIDHADRQLELDRNLRHKSQPTWV
ncbi:MAG: diguanylate cyclase [Proteobacteria bacterium]|nr:diguanylate cyclase [Pseudomonadota bacterium]MCH7893708.1 diguanylate cyclase [Pseudomonadota bacterium]